MEKTVKRKILCFESLWDEHVEQRLSVKPFLEVLENLNGFGYTHITCNTQCELLFHLHKFIGSKAFKDYKILYLSFHGYNGKIVLSDQEQLTLEELADILEQHFKGWRLLLGSCNALCISSKRIMNFLQKTGISFIAGYRKSVDWAEGACFEFIILDHLLNYSKLKAMRHRIETRYSDFMEANGIVIYHLERKRK